MEKKRILIVDDERDLAGIISEMLSGCGFLTDVAGSAEEAFTLLTNTSYHLVLLDINLPDQTGFEICKELRRVSKVPVILRVRAQPKTTASRASISAATISCRNRIP